MATLKLGSTTAMTESGGVVTFPTASSTIAYPNGQQIQVEHLTTDSTYSRSTNSWGEIGLSDSITPRTTTSKIRVQLSSMASCASNVWWMLGLAYSGNSITNGTLGVDDTTPLVRRNPTFASTIAVGVSVDVILLLNQSNTTDAITFTWKLHGQGSTIYLGSRTGTDQHTMMTLTEIAQ